MAEITEKDMVLNTTGLDIEDGSGNWTQAADAANYVTNTNAGPLYIAFEVGTTSSTITFTSQVTCDQGTTHNVALAISANEMRIVGPFQTGRWNDSNNRVQFTISTTSSCRVMAIRG